MGSVIAPIGDTTLRKAMTDALEQKGWRDVKPKDFKVALDEAFPEPKPEEPKDAS